MSRKQRVHYRGAIYHVTARGNNRQIIFNDEFDKMYYLSLLRYYKDKYECELYAYVLMDNHVHLLIAVADQPLAKFMQGVQQCYTQYYNHKYSHVGHVFQQRYNAEICADDSYLLSVVRYIHNNPIKAKIVDRVDYPWSSHKYYLKADCSFVDSSFILGIFSNNKTTAIERYLSFIKELEEFPVMLAGGAGIVTRNSNCVTADHYNISIDELLEQSAKKAGIAIEDILGGSKVRAVVMARRRFIYLALKSGLVTGAELARRLNVSQSQITRAYQIGSGLGE